MNGCFPVGSHIYRVLEEITAGKCCIPWTWSCRWICPNRNKFRSLRKASAYSSHAITPALCYVLCLFQLLFQNIVCLSTHLLFIFGGNIMGLPVSYHKLTKARRLKTFPLFWRCFKLIKASKASGEKKIISQYHL